MIQIYVDNRLAYDSRLEEYALLALTLSQSFGASGVATITMPANHPAYDMFLPYKPIVRIERDGELLFRGRVLYSGDDFYNTRTVTCEGERGFFNDSTTGQSFLLQGDAFMVLDALLQRHNGQVDSEKQYVAGWDTYGGDYRFAIEEPMTTLELMDYLTEQTGRRFVITHDEFGTDYVNWLTPEQFNHRSGQKIEFAENLLDFTRNGQQNEDFCTRVVPYGAKIEGTDVRLDIKSITTGRVDYIQDAAAVAAYGKITKVIINDALTDAQSLYEWAADYLNRAKNLYTSLQLTAVDLSLVNSSIDPLKIGDAVYVNSAPHGIDTETFYITERQYDLLEPSNDTVTMASTLTTYTDTPGRLLRASDQ